MWSKCVNRLVFRIPQSTSHVDRNKLMGVLNPPCLQWWSSCDNGCINVCIWWGSERPLPRLCQGRQAQGQLWLQKFIHCTTVCGDSVKRFEYHERRYINPSHYYCYHYYYLLVLPKNMIQSNITANGMLGWGWGNGRTWTSTFSLTHFLSSIICIIVKCVVYI